jgi:hypothetical protein
MLNFRNTDVHSVLSPCTTTVSKAGALPKEACGLCSPKMFAERPLHEQRLRDVSSSDQIKRVSLCLDFDKSLSAGDHATPLCFHLLQSAEKKIKRAKGPLPLIASPSCAERSLSLGHEVLSVCPPQWRGYLHMHRDPCS